MAYVTPYTFVALQTLTAAQLNAIQTNITALWPYTAAGDISYASAANTLARLAKGTVGQVLKQGAAAPEWGSGGLGTRVAISASQSIPNTTYTDISFNSEIFDTANMYDAGSPTILTVQTSGLYLLGAAICFSPIGGTTSMASKLNVNSIYQTYYTTTGVGHGFHNHSVLAQLTADQTISLSVYHSSDASINVTNDGTKLWALLVG